MIPLPAILSRLSKHEDLCARLSYEALARYYEIIFRYMPRILTTAPRQRKRLPQLEQSIHDVLALDLGLSYAEVATLWAATGDLFVTEFYERESRGHDIPVDVRLASTAPQFGLGAEVMISPIRSCVNENCPQRGQPLGGDRKEFMGTLYTQGRGVLPVQIVTLYCRGCNTTYRPNYSVSNAECSSSMRDYYAGVPKFLEVTQHSYVEEELILLFRHQMAFSHASGDGCAKIYNLTLRKLPGDTPKMTSEIVWHAFYTYALLLDQMRFDSPLRLPHHGEQTDRLAAALRARNDRMVGVGQAQWAHACDDCEKIVQVEDPDHGGEAWARLSACVMDGVCIGHPRCHIYHCTETLQSPRDHFCQSHRHLNSVCAIQGCKLPCADGMRICNLPRHRKVEEDRREQGRAMVELKRRLQARDVASTIRAQPSVDDASALLDDPDLDDPALTSNVERKDKKKKPPKIKSTLTRRWTHNEQLLVRPCGVVVSRATFYEAESLPNCRLFLNATFPRHFPRSRPSFIFFDNNCRLLSHLVNVEDEHLLHMGFPVDVFHAVRKHQESDGYCQDHCNPAGFPELVDDQGKWVYNSSACEQVNVWFAKFLPVVREMSEVHFNFFLDEMVAIRNRVRISELASGGRRPRLIPIEELTPVEELLPAPPQ